MRMLQSDVNEREEAVLRRLEGGSQVGGDDAVDKAVVAAPPVRAQDGAVVSGAVRRSEQMSSKLFKNGGCRDSAKIVKLLPRGGAGLKSKVPKRKDFGDEGEEGDQAHSAAMKNQYIKHEAARQQAARCVSWDVLPARCSCSTRLSADDPTSAESMCALDCKIQTRADHGNSDECIWAERPRACETVTNEAGR